MTHSRNKYARRDFTPYNRIMRRKKVKQFLKPITTFLWQLLGALSVVLILVEAYIIMWLFS